MDSVIHLSEGHRSDMLLDLSGLTREERVVVQASISNERDLDRVAEALIIQHPRFHFPESQKRAKGRGQDGLKTWTLSNSCWMQEKGKHIGSGKSGASACFADFTSVDDYSHDDGTVRLADAHRAHNDQADPGSDIGEEKLRAMTTTRNTIRFFHMLLWTTSPFF